jgi:hypothetical protein
MDNFNYREFIYGQSLFNSKEDEKQQLNENAPGYDNRKFGEALPTLETVQAAHEAKQIAEDDKVIKDLAQADEVIKIIKMMNPDVREDLLKKIARMGQKMDEQMYIDDEEFEMEMGRSKKDSLRKEMMIHVSELLDGNIDMNDFINVVEDIMSELK